MPDTPITLPHSEIRDLLQAKALNRVPLHYRTSAVSFRPAFPGLAANLATFYEWSRLKDADGLGHFLLSNGAVYIDHISPTICGTNADATRSARLELGQFDLRDLDDLLMFVSDDKQKQVADDFGQTEVVHKSATAQQTAIVSPRIMKRVDAVFAEAILKSFFADDALRTIYRERAARLPACWRHFRCPLGRHPLIDCWSPAEASEADPRRRCRQAFSRHRFWRSDWADPRRLQVAGPPPFTRQRLARGRAAESHRALHSSPS